MSNTPNTIEETLKDFVNKYLDEKFGEYAEDNTHLAEALAAIYQLIEREVIGESEIPITAIGYIEQRGVSQRKLIEKQRQRLSNLMKEDSRE